MNKKKILLSVLSLIILAAITISFLGYPGDLPANTASHSYLQEGNYSVAVKDLELIDTSRPTQQADDFEGADERTIGLRLWLPESIETPSPLVIYSHGFLSGREGGTHIAQHLASHGYIVAAPEFPLTSMSSPSPLVKDVVQQPADVRFVIDQLLKYNADNAHELHDLIDPERIGKIGLSLGGMTTVMTSYHPEYYDPRIKAAISVAGPTAMFTETFFAHRDIPFLMIASKIDAMVHYPSNAKSILNKINNASLFTIENGSHAGFSFQSVALRFMDNADQIGCWALKGFVKADNPRDNWLPEIGDESLGVVIPDIHLPCTAPTLPSAMNPIRQQQIETLAAYSFFQLHFAEAEQQAEYQQYLYQTLAAEIDGVTIEKNFD